MNANGYLVLNRDIIGKGITPISGTPPDDNYCRTKDYISSTFNVNTAATPYSSYTTNRYPRYEDVTGICPTCSFATSIGTTTSCFGYRELATATQNIAVNTSCGSYELRLVGQTSGTTTTAWQQGCCSGGPYTFSFTGVNVGGYKVEIRPQSVSGTTCGSTFSSLFKVCCDTSAWWTNNGAAFCGGTNNCTLFQPQIDNNYCSSTYQSTQNVNLGLNDSCGTWVATYYCSNYGVYPFEQRYKEVNSCTGNVRNDTFVANLSTSCGYSCSYWGLSVSFNSQYCSGTTNTSGVVSLNANATNGGWQVRLVSMGSGVTTGWQTSTTFTGVTDGQYYAEIRSTGDNSCTASTGYPYIFVSCYVAPTTTTTTTAAPTTTTTTTTCAPTTYYALNSCSGGATAYTTIAPGGINQQYVLPFPTTSYYTYGGSTVSSCTPPSGYNSSIQIASGQFGCP